MTGKFGKNVTTFPAKRPTDYATHVPSGSIEKLNGDSHATGPWVVRITFLDHRGKRKDVRRRSPSRAQAERLLLSLKNELIETGRIGKTRTRRFREELPETMETAGGVPAEGEQGAKVERRRVLEAGMRDVTFEELAGWYSRHHAREPQIDGHGRRIPKSGLADWKRSRVIAAQFSAFFGELPLRLLEGKHIRAYREAVSQNLTRRKTRRTIATTNRELAVLRRMLRLAMGEGWIDRDPIPWGEVIQTGEEHERIRIISLDEELRLLAACKGINGGARLRGYLEVLIDTGLRAGEARRATWADLDLVAKELTIRPATTKTQRGRVVALSSRNLDFFKTRYQALAKKGFPPASADPLFGFRDNCRSSFERAREKAGLKDVRLHDLRHTAATRWAEAGFGVAEIGRLLGHSQISSVTFRYTNLSDRMRERQREVAEALELQREKKRTATRDERNAETDPEAVLIQRAIRGR